MWIRWEKGRTDAGRSADEGVLRSERGWRSLLSLRDPAGPPLIAAARISGDAPRLARRRRPRLGIRHLRLQGASGAERGCGPGPAARAAEKAGPQAAARFRP